METEDKLMIELGACRECDVCRTLMDDSACLVFNEMYRLFDKESDTGDKINSEELQNLVELCNFCEICPCWNIRAAGCSLIKSHHMRYITPLRSSRRHMTHMRKNV